jgi:cyclopropane fatty-acyl-phospholipid synthase-like methyltransferase
VSSTQAQRVVDYYQATTVPSYLVWAGEALALHLGCGDGGGGDDRKAHEASLLEMNAQLAAAAHVAPGARVLDAGCGVGGSALWLAQERRATVTGVSLDPRQIDLARRFSADRRVAGVHFECADFTHTTFGPGSFDVVWNLESLCHVADVRGYVSHARALLSPGGRFVCGDFFRDRGGPDCDAMCEGWALPNLGSAQALARALADAGFEDVRLRDLTAQVSWSARWMATDRKSTRLNSSHRYISRMPSSA